MQRKRKKNILITVFTIFILSAGFFITKNFKSIFHKITDTLKRPNIVLIIIDALRSDKLGCYGFKKEISPELDRMAQNGILFENVLAQCSWTRPSIGSMVTSLYPRSLGLYKEKFDILHPRYQTISEILKKNGYYTIGITANPNINSVFKFDQGFDEYEDSSVVFDWMKPESYQKIKSDSVLLPRSTEIFSSLIKKVKKKKKYPVYIQINIMEVHSPYIIREKFKTLFQNFQKIKKNRYYPKSKLSKLIRETYGAIRQTSIDIEQFINDLKSIPGMENTLYIITSDHGQGLDDHPDVKMSQTHGRLLYKSHLRVPLIFYHLKNKKKVLKNMRIQKQVRLLDLMPTILEYINIPVPENIHGKSFLGLINNDEQSYSNTHFVAETNWRDVNKIAVYSRDWEYIENRDGWIGVNEQELQLIDKIENGKNTDIISKETEIANIMRKILYSWEKQYQKVKSTQPRKKVSKKEIQQLKTLGYLD